MTTRFDFDLYVIGGGSAGVRCARIAAGHGARVGLAEERFLGGTCVNVGCVPKKLMVYASAFSHHFHDAQGFGWDVPAAASHDWARLIAAKDQEIARLNAIYRQMLEKAGVTIHDSHARLTGPHTIAVAGQEVTAANILIATGGWPVMPGHPGCEHGITSNEVFHLPALPRRIVIAGGGYIAMEFAGVFRGLGREVTVVFRGDRVLRGFEEELRDRIAVEYERQGIRLITGVHFQRVVKHPAGDLTVHLTDGRTLDTDLVLYAIGRAPLTQRIGLDAVPLHLDMHSGAIVVDAEYRTSVPHIHAVGDVTNAPKLTPVAIQEGHVLADRLFGGRNRTVDYTYIPTAIFTQPNLGTVGLSEAEAVARHGRDGVTVYKTDFRAMKHTLGGRAERTFMKLVVERDSDRVIGAHMMGDDAGEIIQGLAVAMNAGATKADFDRTIGIHPTAAEEFVTMRMPAPLLA